MALPHPALPTFGVEEEFLLLDAGTGMPRDCADDMVAALPGLRAEYEYFLSQLETATPVCREASEAFGSLHEFRRAAVAAAEPLGLVIAGTGMPAIGGEKPGQISDSPRYREIHATMRGMVHRYYSTGTHVHVGVPSRDTGIEVMARIARWSPVLLALSANSPLWLGSDTGYASWRYLQMQRWPSSGYPPQFADATQYDAVLDSLVRAGALGDRGLVNWSIRLSEKYPTVELRTADAQLTSAEAVNFGLIVRALVHTALREISEGMPAAPSQPDVLRGAHWLAARDGLSASLVHPEQGEPVPAHDVVRDLITHIAPSLEESGDIEHVAAFVRDRARRGGGAALQRKAWATGGIGSLLDLFLHESAN